MTEDWRGVRYLHQTQDSAVTLVWTGVQSLDYRSRQCPAEESDATQRQQGATGDVTAWKQRHLHYNSENLYESLASSSVLPVGIPRHDPYPTLFTVGPQDVNSWSLKAPHLECGGSSYFSDPGS